MMSARHRAPAPKPAVPTASFDDVHETLKKMVTEKSHQREREEMARARQAELEGKQAALEAHVTRLVDDKTVLLAKLQIAHDAEDEVSKVLRQVEARLLAAEEQHAQVAGVQKDAAGCLATLTGRLEDAQRTQDEAAQLRDECARLRDQVLRWQAAVDDAREHAERDAAGKAKKLQARLDVAMVNCSTRDARIESMHAEAAAAQRAHALHADEQAQRIEHVEAQLAAATEANEALTARVARLTADAAKATKAHDAAAKTSAARIKKLEAQLAAGRAKVHQPPPVATASPSPVDMLTLVDTPPRKVRLSKKGSRPRARPRPREVRLFDAADPYAFPV